MRAFMLVLATLSLSALLSASPAQADTISCQGTLRFPSQFVHTNCYNGLCNGTVPGYSLTLSGSCQSAGTPVTYSASTYSPSQFFSGQCTFSRLSAYVSGASMNVTGVCSNGGRFQAQAFLPGEFISGSCNPNGFSSIYTYGSSAQIFGHCVKN